MGPGSHENHTNIRQLDSPIVALDATLPSLPASTPQPNSLEILQVCKIVKDIAREIYGLASTNPELNDTSLIQAFEAGLKRSAVDYGSAVKLISSYAKAPLIPKEYSTFEAFELKLFQIFDARHPTISRRSFLKWCGSIAASLTVSNNLVELARRIEARALPTTVSPSPFILEFNESRVMSQVAGSVGARVLGAKPAPSLGLILNQGVISHWDNVLRTGIRGYRNESDQILIGEGIQTIPGVLQRSGLLSDGYSDFVHAHVISEEMLKDPKLNDLFSILKKAQAITTQVGPSSQIRISNQLSQLASRSSELSLEEMTHLLHSNETISDVRIFNEYLPRETLAEDRYPNRIFLQVKDPFNLSAPKIVILEEPTWDLPRGHEDLMTYRVFVFNMPFEPVPSGDQAVTRFRETHFGYLDGNFVGTANLRYNNFEERVTEIHDGEGFRPLPLFNQDNVRGIEQPGWLVDVVRDYLQQNVVDSKNN